MEQSRGKRRSSFSEQYLFSGTNSSILTLFNFGTLDGVRNSVLQATSVCVNAVCQGRCSLSMQGAAAAVNSPTWDDMKLKSANGAKGTQPVQGGMVHEGSQNGTVEGQPLPQTPSTSIPLWAAPLLQHPWLV